MEKLRQEFPNCEGRCSLRPLLFENGFKEDTWSRMVPLSHTKWLASFKNCRSVSEVLDNPDDWSAVEDGVGHSSEGALRIRGWRSGSDHPRPPLAWLGHPSQWVRSGHRIGSDACWIYEMIQKRRLGCHISQEPVCRSWSGHSFRSFISSPQPLTLLATIPVPPLPQPQLWVFWQHFCVPGNLFLWAPPNWTPQPVCPGHTQSSLLSGFVTSNTWQWDVGKARL